MPNICPFCIYSKKLQILSKAVHFLSKLPNPNPDTGCPEFSTFESFQQEYTGKPIQWCGKIGSPEQGVDSEAGEDARRDCRWTYQSNGSPHLCVRGLSQHIQLLMHSDTNSLYWRFVEQFWFSLVPGGCARPFPPLIFSFHRVFLAVV